MKETRTLSLLFMRSSIPLVLLLIMIASPLQSQTFQQAVTDGCAVVGTPVTLCTGGSIIASTGSPTALTTEASPVEERTIERLIGSFTFWLGGEYERFHKNLTIFEPAYKTDIGRTTLGADYAFYNHSLVLGGAFTYAKIDGRFLAGGRLETDSYSPLLYLNYRPTSRFSIDVDGAYARKNHFLSRRVLPILIPGLSLGTATGRPDANEFFGGVSGRYDFTFDNVTIGPRLSLHYKHQVIESYREQGNTNFNLIYDRQAESSLTSALGLFGSIVLKTDFGVLRPQVTLKYVHEFMDDQRRIRFRFVNDPTGRKFAFQNDSPDRDYFDLSLGIAVISPQRKFQPYIKYRALLGYNNQSSHIATMGLRMAF